MSQPSSGLRFRLVLLAVLASLPPVVLTLHIARQDRQRQTAALRQRSQDMVSLRKKAVRGASLGVLSMEERATLAGGGVQYHSTPSQGTEVHAWFPLKWAHPAVLIGAI